MIKCTPCKDVELIISVLKDPLVWSNIAEDGMDYDNFVLPPSLSFFTLTDNDTLLGVCALRPLSSVCAELHTCLLRSAAGKSNAAFSALAVLLLESTALESLITIIPEVNKLAIAAAKRSGFISTGFLPYSYSKGGEIVGQHIYQVIL